jgi:hypothetical protein
MAGICAIIKPVYDFLQLSMLSDSFSVIFSEQCLKAIFGGVNSSVFKDSVGAK